MFTRKIFLNNKQDKEKTHILLFIYITKVSTFLHFDDDIYDLHMLTDLLYLFSQIVCSYWDISYFWFLRFYWLISVNVMLVDFIGITSNHIHSLNHQFLIYSNIDELIVSSTCIRLSKIIFFRTFSLF